MNQAVNKYALIEHIEMQVDGEAVTIKEVNLTKPKGKHLRLIAKKIAAVEADPLTYSEGDMTLDCIELLTDLPEGAADEMDLLDITALGDIIGPFLEMAMGGGGSSSTLPSGTKETGSK